VIYAIGCIHSSSNGFETQLLENSDTGDIIWQHQARTSVMHFCPHEDGALPFQRPLPDCNRVTGAPVASQFPTATQLGSDAEAPEQQPSTLLETTHGDNPHDGL